MRFATPTRDPLASPTLARLIRLAQIPAMIPANDPDGPEDEDGMRVYFVRMIEDRQVVGLFMARDVVELARVVDECCDVSLCEYTVTDEPGGLYVSGFTEAQWPPRDDESGEDMHVDDRNPLNEAEFSYGWWSDLNAGAWHPLV